MVDRNTGLCPERGSLRYCCILKETVYPVLCVILKESAGPGSCDGRAGYGRKKGIERRKKSKEKIWLFL